LSPLQAEEITDWDFSYFAACMVPDANAETFRLICDWGNWIFTLDDLFDNGELQKDDDTRAWKMIEHLSSSFTRLPSTTPSPCEIDICQYQHILDFHQHIWGAIRSSDLAELSDR
ncbi:hypothetical protein LTR86_011323, partial [Recurvomyces mirabilis]